MLMHFERSSRMSCRLIAVSAALVVVASVAGKVRAEALKSSPGQQPAPVPRLFERVHDSFSGRILTVVLTHADAPEYEVKFLTAGGNVLMLSYDAMSLRLDSVVGHRDTGDEKDNEIKSARDDRSDSDGSANSDDDDDNSGPGGGGDDDDRDDDRDDGHDGGNSGSGGGNSGSGSDDD